MPADYRLAIGAVSRADIAMYGTSCCRKRLAEFASIRNVVGSVLLYISRAGLMMKKVGLIGWRG
ncbi:MAG: hypothetical protein QMB70_06145, partial [Aeromonadaceae bacterium]